MAGAAPLRVQETTFDLVFTVNVYNPRRHQHRSEKRSMRELAALRTVSASAGVGGEW
jgi:hypothetical protein